MTAKHRTLFIPALHGQFKLWENIVDQEAAKADQVISLGSSVGVNSFAADKGYQGLNLSLLKVLQKRVQLDKWTSLVGPNEIVALQVPGEWLGDHSASILRELWMEKVMKVATTHAGRLVTHGGLTYGEWLSLDRPQTAEETAKMLNEKYARTLYQGECYILGNGPNYTANPIWCHSSRELVPSWISAPESLPFDQITGSESLNSTEGRAIVTNDSIYSKMKKIRYRHYGADIEVKGQRILSLDLGISEKRVNKLPNESQLYIEERNF